LGHGAAGPEDLQHQRDDDRDLDDFNATATAPWLRIADAPLSTVVTNVIALYAAVLCA
jgi:hypothetical protein